jgi:hypothetical protein
MHYRISFYAYKCGDTSLLLQADKLTVNGKSYGTLRDRDPITVNYGKVFVNSTERVADR